MVKSEETISVLNSMKEEPSSELAQRSRSISFFPRNKQTVSVFNFPAWIFYGFSIQRKRNSSPWFQSFPFRLRPKKFPSFDNAIPKERGKTTFLKFFSFETNFCRLRSVDFRRSGICLCGNAISGVLHSANHNVIKLQRTILAVAVSYENVILVMFKLQEYAVKNLQLQLLITEDSSRE